ncbi:unnamed protein product [Nezara viridula]|uniref:Uncharacterized protein n=1 Tax=Nezara viridula TaxID=85310 RepID=A0A9P0HAV6_NEZVI|nr:unnamed protein product [Nezara viridula]
MTLKATPSFSCAHKSRSRRLIATTYLDRDTRYHRISGIVSIAQPPPPPPPASDINITPFGGGQSLPGIAGSLFA